MIPVTNCVAIQKQIFVSHFLGEHPRNEDAPDRSVGTGGFEMMRLCKKNIISLATNLFICHQK